MTTNRDGAYIIGTLLDPVGGMGQPIKQTLWSDGVVTLVVDGKNTHYKLREFIGRVQFQWREEGEWRDFLDACSNKDFATKMIEMFNSIAFEEHVLGVKGDKPTRENT